MNIDHHSSFISISDCSKMKSICFIVATPFTANAFLLDHLKQLSLLYKVTLCLNLKLYPLSPGFDLNKIQIIDIPIERKVHPLKDLKTLFFLYFLFRRIHFDVVHTISPKAGLLGMLAASLGLIEHRFHTFTGQVWANSKGIQRSFYKLIDRLICRLATSVFADSQSQINFLVEEGICQRKQITMLGAGSISGVNIDRFRPDRDTRIAYRKSLCASEKDIVFLFVGRLCRDKGVYDLLAAFDECSADLKGRKFLWLVGPDEEGLGAALRAIYPHLENQIKWIGPTLKPEIYMAAADILVLPSFREGFGSVVIEAAACKVPAIAYKTEGIVDAINDHQTGLLAKKYDVNDLASLMKLLSSDEGLRQTLSVNAFVRARTCFSSRIVTEHWVNFYKKVLSI